jgi:hypothetical protein
MTSASRGRNSFQLLLKEMGTCLKILEYGTCSTIESVTTVLAPSSRGLGRLVFIQKIAGSNPAGVTFLPFSAANASISLKDGANISVRIILSLVQIILPPNTFLSSEECLIVMFGIRGEKWY